MGNQRACRNVGALLCALGFTPAAPGTTYTWSAGSSGSYSNVNNWNFGAMGSIPGAADLALFPGNSASIRTVEFFTDPTVGQVSAEGDFFFRPRTVSRTYTILGDLNVVGGGDLDVIPDSGSSAQLDLLIGGTLRVDSASEMTASNGLVKAQTLDLDGLLIVQNSQSALTIDTAGDTSIGDGGNSATLTIRGSATGDFAGMLRLGADASAGSSGSFNIESGADVIAAGLTLGGGSGSGSAGQLAVSGAGSTLVQSAASTLSVGGAAGTGAGALTIANGASFTSGTGAATIGSTGSVVVDNGTLNVRGDWTFASASNLNFTGGTIKVDGGSVDLTSSYGFGGTGGNHAVWNIVNNGLVEYGFSWRIGDTVGSSGQTIVSGALSGGRSTLRAGGGGGGADVIVGNNGNGTMQVVEGALVEPGDDLYVGRNTGVNAVMTVDGRNGEFRSTVDVSFANSTSNSIFVGGGESSTAGNGTLNIVDGALVTTSGSVLVGSTAGSVGAIHISGSNPFTTGMLEVGNDLVIGGTTGAAGGTGTVTSSEIMQVGDLVKIWSGGTLDLQGGSRLAASHIDVDGGLLSIESTGSPGALTVPTVNVRNGGTLEWRAGALGVGQNIAIVIDNGTLAHNTATIGMLLLGLNGNTGTLTLTNGSTGSINTDAGLSIGHGASGGTGVLNITNDSELHSIGNINVEGLNAQLNVTQLSELILSGSAALNQAGSMLISDSSVVQVNGGAATVRNVTLANGGRLEARGGPLTILGNANNISGGIVDALDHVTVSGTLTARLGQDLRLRTGKSLMLTTHGSSLTLLGSAVFGSNNLFAVSGNVATASVGENLTLAGGSELRVTDGALGVAQTLEIDGTSTLHMSAGGSVGGTVTTRNLTLQSGSTFILNRGVVEVAGGTLSVGNPSLSLIGLGSGIDPVLRLRSGASGSVAAQVVVDGGADLEILSGSTLASQDGVIGPTPGTSGSVLVQDLNSNWSVTQLLVVGGNAARTPAGSGTLSVQGGATGNAGLDMRVGSNGFGTVNIASGGAVLAGSLTVGEEAGGNGTVNVTAGSLTLDQGVLQIGRNGGTGQVISTGPIDAGFAAEVGAGSISVPSGNGTLVLKGGSASLDAGSVNVGRRATGLLEILDGASVVSNGGTIGSAGSGTVTLESEFGNSTTSRWTMSQTLSVGQFDGVGTLNIRDGASVASPVAHLAGSVESTAAATLNKSIASGARSAWTGAALYIGGTYSAGGQADVSVLNHSELAFSDLIKIWPAGTLTIGGSTTPSVTTGRIDRYNPSATPGALAWSRGHITLTNSNLHVGDAPDSSDYFLGDNAVVPANSTLTLSGAIIVGEPGVTGAGALTIRDTVVTGAAAHTLIGSAGALHLENGTLDTARLELRAGSVFNGSGLVDAKVWALAGATLNVTGNLTMGDASAFDGFVTDAHLNVGAHDVTLRSRGFVNLGLVTTIQGGALNAARIALDVGDSLVGAGQVNAAFSAGAGSVIEATANLSLGSAGAVDGYFSDGTLLVNQHAVTLLDANQAVLGSLTALGSGSIPGTLAAAHGAVIDFGRNVTGFGTLDTPNDPFTPLINNGEIRGDSAAEPITLTGYVKGVGTMSNVVITGSDAPGFSPAAIYRGSVAYQGTLEIEIGGLAAGTQHDQVNHSGTATLGGTLDLSLINGSVPAPTDTFEILTHAARTSTFGIITGHAIAPDRDFAIHYTDHATTAIAGQWHDAQLSGIVDVPGALLDVTGDVSFAGELEKRGPGRLAIDLAGGSATVAPGARLSVHAGTMQLKSDVGAASPHLAIHLIGGDAVFESTQQLASLEVGAQHRATLVAAGDRLLRTAAIELHGSGTLDLANNRLVVEGGDPGAWNGVAYTGVAGLIDAGRGDLGNALWNGNGIMTSDPRAVGTGNLGALGIATAGQLGRTSFGGHSVAADDVLVMFTWGGDANLDGKINIDDYGRIDSHVAVAGASGWFNGDFNYDGRINIDDYGIIDSNISRQSEIFGLATSSAGGVIAVPEPSFAGLAGLALLVRRRRRSTTTARL